MQKPSFSLRELTDNNFEKTTILNQNQKVNDQEDHNASKTSQEINDKLDQGYTITQTNVKAELIFKLERVTIGGLDPNQKYKDTLNVSIINQATNEKTPLTNKSKITLE